MINRLSSRPIDEEWRFEADILQHLILFVSAVLGRVESLCLEVLKLLRDLEEVWKGVAYPSRSFHLAIFDYSSHFL